MLVIKDTLRRIGVGAFACRNKKIHFITFIIYAVIWNIYSALEYLTSCIKFTKSTRQCKGVTTRKSIIWRMKCRGFSELPTPVDFFGIYQTSIDPSYVMKDHVTLYCIYDEYAFFVETPKDIDMYDPEKNPFFVESQFTLATHIIKMPLNVAHTLATQLGDPKANVLCLSHTGRAGSTLVAQIFNKTGQVQTISMADPYRCMFTTYANLPENLKGDLMLTIMRLLCKPVSGYANRPLLLVKVRSNDMVLTPLWKKYVPWMKHILLYRRGLETVKSFQSIITHVDWEILLKIKPIRHLFFSLRGYTYPMIGDCNLIDSNFMIACWHYGSRMADVIKFNKKYDIPTFRFEDILLNPDNVIRDMFNIVNLPGDLVSVAKTAMDTHSHANSAALSKPRANTTKYEGNAKEKADILCDNLGIPHLDTNIHL